MATPSIMKNLPIEGGSSPLTTKGDIFTFSTTNDRLPVGTNGQILESDSTQATGLKWITNPGQAPGGSDSQVQFNDGGVFGGAAALIYDKVDAYTGIGVDSSLPLVLTHPFQVGGGNTYLPPTTVTGTINYHTPPAPPSGASISASYFQAILDPATFTGSQVDGGSPGSYYLADGTVSLDFYVAAYKTVSGTKIFSPGVQTFHFTDNSDAANFYIQIDWASVTGATGYQLWRNGTYNGNTASFDTIDMANALSLQDTGFAFWAAGVAHPPTPTALGYAATGNTIDYHIYDYVVADGVNLYSTTSTNLSLTDNNSSQHPPPSGTATVNTAAGTYVSNNYTHNYIIWSQYADGGYSSTSLSKSVADGGPTIIADASGFTAVQNPSGSGYTASGNSMTYTLVSYKFVAGQTIYSPGVNANFTDDSSFAPYSVSLSWTPPAGSPDGYVLFISSGPHTYTYYSQNIGNVVSFNDSDSGWNLQYPFPMNSFPDPGFISAVQNDAETGYLADGTNSFTYRVSAYVSGAGGYIQSPGSVNTVFTDNNDASTFGIDLNWAAVAASGNGKVPDGYIIYVTGTTPYNTGYFYQNVVSGTSLIDQASGWTAAAAPFVYPPYNPANHPFTYEIQLSWTAVPTATSYLVLKSGGDSGWSYNFYFSTASTSFNDTDDSIWTAYGGSNPPLPVEANTSYEVLPIWTGVGGTTYRALRQVNAGGFTTYHDTAPGASGFIDGNYSFSWLGSPTVTNTLYAATGATRDVKVYSYNNAHATYSTTHRDQSVTDNNSGNYYSVTWASSNYATGVDKLKLIINTANSELLTSPTLSYLDINQGYNSNTTVTPNTTTVGFYSDSAGNVAIDTLTILSTIITPKIGSGTGLVQLGSGASSAGTGGIAIGDGATQSSTNGIAIGVSASSVGGSSISIGQVCDVNGNSAVGVGAGAYAHGAGAAAFGPGSRATATDALAIGDTAQATNSSATAIGANATCSAQGGLAAGNGAQSSNFQSLALGYGAISSGNSASAIGFGSNAAGDQSIALGYQASSQSSTTIAIGRSALVNGQFGIAMGYVAQASGGTDIAIGFGTNSSGNVSVVIGASSSTTSSFTASLGYNAVIGSSSNGSSILGYQGRISTSGNAAILGYIGTITGSSNSYIVGSNGSITSSSGSSGILGSSNTITTSTTSYAIGYNNSITGSANSTVIGQSNTVAGASGGFGTYTFGQGNNIGAISSFAIGQGLSPGAGFMQIGYGSSGPTITLNSNNNRIGINTTSPAFLFDINGTLNAKIHRFQGSTSGSVTIQPAAVAGAWTMTLPIKATPTDGLLQTDGTGITIWADPVVNNNETICANDSVVYI